MMSTLPSLFRLPSSILSAILSKYLTIDNVCVLDTAVSEKRSRQILVNLFLSAEVVFEDNRDRDGRDFLSWSKERGLVLSRREHVSISSACTIKQRCRGLLLMVAKEKCQCEACEPCLLAKHY